MKRKFSANFCHKSNRCSTDLVLDGTDKWLEFRHKSHHKSLQSYFNKISLFNWFVIRLKALNIESSQWTTTRMTIRMESEPKSFDRVIRIVLIVVYLKRHPTNTLQKILIRSALFGMQEPIDKQRRTPHQRWPNRRSLGL